MQPKDYIVTRIEGEYAYLAEIGNESEEIFIALYLLPMNVDIGTIKSRISRGRKKLRNFPKLP